MSEYNQTVQKIKQLLDSANCHYQCFEHEAVRISEEAAALRSEYSLAQGETVRGTVTRGDQIFLEVPKRNIDNLNSYCKKQKHLYV
ncbi:MAG: hypothetical protein ACI92I_000131 [Acidimicrobiales bacterium]|jgi:hypothetical protein